MSSYRIGVVFENACRLAGRDPSLLPPPPNWPVLAAMSIDAGIRALAAEKFPMMQRIEFRRYRPEWKPGTVYRQGNEVWFDRCYWRLTDAAHPGQPGIVTGWTRLDDREVAAFIAWEQPWENSVMDPAGTDMTRFAYVQDPKYQPDAAPCRIVGTTSLGIELAAPAPHEGVYCRFVPKFPLVSLAEWTAGGHAAGDVVYRTSTKDVYECTSDIPEEHRSVAPESDSDGYWRPVRVRSEFVPYLTRLAASDLMTEDQGKYQTQAAARAEFDLLCERYHEGVGDSRVRTGRFV